MISTNLRNYFVILLFLLVTLIYYFKYYLNTNNNLNNLIKSNVEHVENNKQIFCIILTQPKSLLTKVSFYLLTCE